MAWTTFDYQAGPVGGSYTDLLDYCDSVVIKSEMDSPKRGNNPAIPYRDGEYSFPQKFRDSGVFMLECMISYTDSAGLDTHADGQAGQVFENLQAMKRLIGGNNQTIAIRRTAPHMGAVEAVAEFMGGVRAAGPRMKFIFAMRLLDGMWREQTLSTDTEASISSFPHAYTITTGGDHTIYDAKYTFTCVAAGIAPTFELDVAGDKISVAGSFATSDIIIVDLGRDRVITLNGTRYASVSPNRGYWIGIPPDTASLGVTLDAGSGTWTMDLAWRNKWL